MSRSLDELLPGPRSAARRALARLDELESQYVVMETRRTYLQQAARHAQGRESLEVVNAKRAAAGYDPIVPYLGKDGLMHSDNEYTVTDCDGRRIAEGGTGRSPHQLRTALDVVPDLDPSERQRPGWPPASDPRWLAIAEAFEAEGFEWGGRWTAPYSPDPPHYQYKVLNQ